MNEKCIWRGALWTLNKVKWLFVSIDGVICLGKKKTHYLLTSAAEMSKSASLVIREKATGVKDSRNGCSCGELSGRGWRFKAETVVLFLSSSSSSATECSTCAAPDLYACFVPLTDTAALQSQKV